MRCTFTILSILLAGLSLRGSTVPLSDSADIQTALQEPANIGRPFVLTGDIVQYARGISNEWNVFVQCGAAEFFLKDMSGSVRPGASAGLDSYAYLDRVRFHGNIFKGDKSANDIYLGFLRAERLSTGNTDLIPDITLTGLADQDNLERLVLVEGTVRAATRDESDPNFVHLELRRDGASAHVSVHITTSTPFDPERYLGADVRLCGVCRNYNHKGLRRYFGHVLAVSGLENVRILKPPTSIADAADIRTLSDLTPPQIADSGFVRVQGSVLAVWGKSSVLLKSADGRLVRIRLQQSRAPAFGEQIIALGLPVTDFYAINLIHARWQATGLSPLVPDEAHDATPASLLAEDHGKPLLMVRQQGQPLRFSGIVRYLSDVGSHERLLQIESDGALIPIDVSANPHILDNLQLGCRVSVSGTCIVNADNWNTDAPQDVARRFFLVPRTPSDIVVLSQPPWWTPHRMIVLLAILTGALFAVIGWNISLNRRARIRGRELADERIAYVTSELKVAERTRLAIELHDMLSQMLSGISMQIGTVRKFFDANPDKALDHLDIASKTLLACRENLRDCLWDLRNHAIEEPDLSKAIRDTLEPHVGDVALAVRFSVPRDRLTDNATHAILSIIRELVVNALRHGEATSIKIAGSVENGKVLFSVADNGTGFDPQTAPGMTQGHFGLQGIRERVESFEGDLSVESAAGRGTKVTIALRLPSDDTENPKDE